MNQILKEILSLLTFLAKYKAPPAGKTPIVPPAVAPQPPTHDATQLTVTAVSEAVREYNNGLALFKIASEWTNPIKGATIHKISDAQAGVVARNIVQYATLAGLPIPYVMACLAIESTFDPQCVNKNLGPGGSNPKNDPLGYDTGIAQLKLKYLPDTLGDQGAKRIFALDPSKAIPYHCHDMAGRLKAAKDLIGKTSSSAVDPRLESSPLLLATAMYNFGISGGTKVFEAGQFPSHCQHVLDLERMFASRLGMPSAIKTELSGGVTSK